MTGIPKATFDQPVNREEEEIIRDAEKVRFGEEAEIADRARDIADGVDFAVAPEDLEAGLPGESPEGTTEVDFEDRETKNEDHGRALV